MICPKCNNDLDKDPDSDTFIVNQGCRGDDVVLWCGQCGSRCFYYDAYEPEEDDWVSPKQGNFLQGK